jgi:rubrerythrin
MATATKTASRTRHHLEQAFAVESRNGIRFLFLAERADADGDHELAAVLRDMSVQENLHALKLLELIAPHEDLATGRPVRTACQVLMAALAYQKRLAYETFPVFAQIAHDEGSEEAADWFARLAEATEEQIRRLEALHGR